MRRAALAFVLVAAAVAVAPAQDAPKPAPSDSRPRGPVPPGEDPSDAEAAEIADLVADLAAAEAHVRDMASDGLTRLGARAVPAIVAALEGPHARARVAAARTLARIGGPAAASALDALRRAATGADAELASAARAAISAIEATAPRLDDLRARIASSERAARVDAVRKLPDVAAGERAEAAEILFALTVQEKDEAVRIAALEAGAAMGDLAPRALAGALRALTEGTPRVRAAAVAAEIALGRRAAFDLLQSLAEIHAQRSDDRRARPWILAALAEIPEPEFPARGLETQSAEFAAAAADLLGAARPVVPGVVPALAAATAAGRPSIVRRQAALALGALGDDGTNVGADALIALLADHDSRAQVEAAVALRQILAAMAERPSRPVRAPADVQRALESGLDWLAAHQDEDGGWDCDGFEKHDPRGDPSGGAGKTENDDGVTAFAALAFARCGAVPAFGATDAHGVALRRALVKLVAQQDAEGCYTPRRIKHWIYTHAIGALAMVEAYRRTGSPLWGDSAQRALDFLAACRNPEGSWRYEVRGKDADTSVNGWVVQALRAGERAGLRVDRSGYAPVLRYLASATDPATGRVGYLPHTRESARTNEMLKKFPPALTTAMTSSASVQRLLLGCDPKADPLLAKGLELVRRMPPVWDAAGGRTDLYSWISGTEAMSYVGGDPWIGWKKELRDALVPAQCDPKSGARAGSWDPDDPWGPDGGRVYSTAAAVLCLAVHQGHVPPLPRDPTTDGRGLRIARALEAAAKDPANHESVRQAARAALAAVR